MAKTKKTPQFPKIAQSQTALKREARQLTRLLKGKRVLKVWRHRRKELVIEFTDGTRLFVDSLSNGVETSVT